MPAPPPPNEADRQAELDSLSILDTVPEAAFDAITLLASQICDAPIALISIIDRDRQWFKSRIGLDLVESPRDRAFCAWAIHDASQVMVVPDATEDARFAENPFVTADPNIRFYAGAPLATKRGNALGTLCVIDREPRELTPEQHAALEALSVQVVALLELRKTVDDLNRSQRELEAARRQRETFMAMVSHEIRTPLTSLIGFLEILGSSELDRDTHQEVIEAMTREATDIQHLIEDLLVAARAAADSLSVQTTRVDLAPEVEEVIAGLRMIDSVETALEPCAVNGDAPRIRQIVRNLLTNAVRYGGPDIAVADEHRDGRCHLLVTDDGEGIPVEDRERIFRSFDRGTGVRDVENAVGLGLPISRLLAEKMGGTLTYRYEGGRSVFDLELPVAEALEGAPAG